MLPKSISVVSRVCEQFEHQTAGHMHSDHHPYPTFRQDLDEIVKVLHQEEMLQKKDGRTFLLSNINERSLTP